MEIAIDSLRNDDIGFNSAPCAYPFRKDAWRDT